MSRWAGARRAVGRACRPPNYTRVVVGVFVIPYFVLLFAGGTPAASPWGEPPPALWFADRAAKGMAGLGVGAVYVAAVVGIWLGSAAVAGWLRGYPRTPG